MLTVTAPAKINLTLEVLSHRMDGYHEIRSIIQTIKLADTIEFNIAESTSISCDNPAWKPEKSLVTRAISLFMEQAGIPGGVQASIQKRIPFSSGLGGESSAAAATLLSLNRLFSRELPLGELYRLAGLLGSDVAYFLTGGTALITGRGEKVSPLPHFPHHWIVLVLPEGIDPDDKTGKMYARLTPANYTSGRLTDQFISRLTAWQEERDFELFNVFEEVAFELYQPLKKYVSRLQLCGATGVFLAGAGPCLFTLENNHARAENICQQALDSGMSAIITETTTEPARPVVHQLLC